MDLVEGFHIYPNYFRVMEVTETTSWAQNLAFTLPENHPARLGRPEGKKCMGIHGRCDSSIHYDRRTSKVRGLGSQDVL